MNDSRVVIYARETFLRLATGITTSIALFMVSGFLQNWRGDKKFPKSWHIILKNVFPSI